MKSRSSGPANRSVSVGLVVIVLVPLVLGCNPPGSTGSDPIRLNTVAEPVDRLKSTRPLDLHIVYRPTGEEVAGAFQGEMTVEFKNRLPLPVRIAFPPVGVFGGGSMPFCGEGQDSIPEFAKEPRIVEIGPKETKMFTAPSGVWAPCPNQVEWVFGKPAEGEVPKNLFVGSLYSTYEVRDRQGEGTTNGHE